MNRDPEQQRERWGFIPADATRHEQAVAKLQREAKESPLADEFAALVNGTTDPEDFFRVPAGRLGARRERPVLRTAHERAESAVRDAQREGGHIIPFLIFFRWFKSAMRSYKAPGTFADAGAVSLANTAVEQYAVDLLADANLTACVAKRSFVTSADLQVAISMQACRRFSHGPYAHEY